MSGKNRSKKESEASVLSISEAGYYQLIGEYTKETIPSNELVIDRAFNHEKPVEIDLSNVTRCDSALVALLVQYKRLYPNIAFQNLPDKLNDLLKIYGVDQFIH